MLRFNDRYTYSIVWCIFVLSINHKRKTMLTYTASNLSESLKNEYNLDNKVHPLGQDVVFFGTELDCYKMSYLFKNKESRVAYSENLNTWCVSFPEWFDVDFSQKIA